MTVSASNGVTNSSGSNTGTSSGTSTSSGASVNQAQSHSFVPDYEPQLGFLQQFGNAAGNLANQQYNWAGNQFDNNTNLTDSNINNYLMQHDLASQGAQRDYANYNDIFNPAASSLTNDWQSYTSPDRVASEMGSSEANVAQNFEGQRKNLERGLQSYGINPSDPRYAGSMAANRTSQAAAEAGAGTQARLNTEATGRQLRQEALNEAHLLPGQTATEQNVGMQGLTGAENSAMANTSMGALTLGTTPQYLTTGVNDVKFQPLGTSSSSTGISTNDANSANSSFNQGDNASSGTTSSTTHPTGVGGIGTGPAPNNDSVSQYYPSGTHLFAEGGAIPDDDDQGGGYVPPSMSPSHGQQTDDIQATVDNTGGQAHINAGEFVMPQDVVQWMGHKFFQDLIMKSRKARMSAPAHPTSGPGGQPQHAAGGEIGAQFQPTANMGDTAQTQPTAADHAGNALSSDMSAFNSARPGASAAQQGMVQSFLSRPAQQQAQPVQRETIPMAEPQGIAEDGDQPQPQAQPATDTSQPQTQPGPAAGRSRPQVAGMSQVQTPHPTGGVAGSMRVLPTMGNYQAGNRDQSFHAQPSYFTRTPAPARTPNPVQPATGTQQPQTQPTNPATNNSANAAAQARDAAAAAARNAATNQQLAQLHQSQQSQFQPGGGSAGPGMTTAARLGPASTRVGSPMSGEVMSGSNASTIRNADGSTHTYQYRRGGGVRAGAIPD